MDIQTFSNSRYGINFGLFLGRSLPPRFGYFVSKILANIIANRKTSPLCRSIRLNQWMIHDQNLSPIELDNQVKKVLIHAGHCLFDLFHSLNDKEIILQLSPPTNKSKQLIELSHNHEQGGFIVAPHLSNFDLVFLANGFRGLQGKVLTHGNPTSGYQIQNKIREETGLEIIPITGEDDHKKIINQLKDGQYVITAIDRPIKRKKRYLSFFGHPSPVPAGHIRMALEANIPITVAAAMMNPSGLYEILLSDPLEMIHKGDPEEEIRINGEAVLKVIETFIRQAPEQWLMYYPVWPQFMDQVP